LSGHKDHPAQEASDAKKSQSVIPRKAGYLPHLPLNPKGTTAGLGV